VALGESAKASTRLTTRPTPRKPIHGRRMIRPITSRIRHRTTQRDTENVATPTLAIRVPGSIAAVMMEVFHSLTLFDVIVGN